MNTPLRCENIIPILRVADMQASLRFYVGILGFTPASWGTDNFACVSKDQSAIYLCRDAQGNRGTWIWVGVDADLSELYQELLTKGVEIHMPPSNFSWAFELQVKDPDGHILRFATDPKSDRPFLDLEPTKAD